MKYKLSIISLIAMLALLCSCSAPNSLGVSADTAAESDSRNSESEEKYIDSFIFLGESTTYHLKNRGVLRDGKNTLQVWAPKNGTVNLDTTIKTLKIVYPETGEEMTVGKAVNTKKPKRILLTFGLNGAVEKINRGEKFFRSCYLSLINEIRKNSPETEITLHSCFPIANTMDMTNYSVDATTLMGYINIINGWTSSLAQDEGLDFINTADSLKNEHGFLSSEYDVGDGHHLTAEAYLKMIEIIKKHGEKQ